MERVYGQNQGNAVIFSSFPSLETVYGLTQIKKKSILSDTETVPLQQFWRSEIDALSEIEITEEKDENDLRKTCGSRTKVVFD